MSRFNAFAAIWQFTRIARDYAFPVSEFVRIANDARACGIVRDGSGVEQLKFAEYLISGRPDPNHTFRQHVRKIGGAIEEQDRPLRPAGHLVITRAIVA